MDESLPRIRESLVLLKKFAVRWALIGGMVVYTLLAGAKQLGERVRSMPSTSSDPETIAG